MSPERLFADIPSVLKEREMRAQYSLVPARRKWLGYKHSTVAMVTRSEPTQTQRGVPRFDWLRSSLRSLRTTVTSSLSTLKLSNEEEDEAKEGSASTRYHPAGSLRVRRLCGVACSRRLALLVVALETDAGRN